MMEQASCYIALSSRIHESLDRGQIKMVAVNHVGSGLLFSLNKWPLRVLFIEKVSFIEYTASKYLLNN